MRESTGLSSLRRPHARNSFVSEVGHDRTTVTVPDSITGGVYMVSSDGVYATANDVVDYRSLHNGRDLAKLFSVG